MIISQGKGCSSSLLNMNELVDESKESGVVYVLIGMEEMQPQMVPENVKGLLEEFADVMPEELPDSLPPMTEI